MVTGGASAPVETIRAWRRAAPGALVDLLGMLETGYQAYTRPSDDPERVAGSVGVPASHMGLRLVDTEGRDVAPGAEGDICCDGPSVHLGYHHNPAANAEAFLPDGWFRSGDLGMIDADGRLRIVGRLKEMINRGGKKFFPREIEEILYTHPQVLYAAIVGIPDARLGERNCLCLVPRAGRRRPSKACSAFWATASPPTSCRSGSGCSPSSRHADRQNPASRAGARGGGADRRRRWMPGQLGELKWMNATQAFRGC